MPSTVYYLGTIPITSTTSSAPDTIFLGADAGTGAVSASESNFIGLEAGNQAINAFASNFIGSFAGYQATGAQQSNFIGYYAGYSASIALNSNFIGNNAGWSAVNANDSTFIGTQAGSGATNAYEANFIGYYAGQQAVNAEYSNFLGDGAGYHATNAANSNFIGVSAGNGCVSASYSNFIGWHAGLKIGGGAGLGTNNLIIGNNITLPPGSRDSMNIGGIIFASGSYSSVFGSPYSGSVAEAKVGIGVVTPAARLHLAASTTLTALMRLEVGATPSSPVDGDVWLESNTNTGLKIRINGVTKTITLS